MSFSDTKLKTLGQLTAAITRLNEAIDLILAGGDRRKVIDLIEDGDNIATAARRDLRYVYDEDWNDNDSD
jgi:hypothetical protein